MLEPATKKGGGHTTLPLSMIREQAILLHQLLAGQWRCEGHDPHMSCNLQLAMHREVADGVCFNMLFFPAPGSSLKWQQGEAKGFPRRYSHTSYNYHHLS